MQTMKKISGLESTNATLEIFSDCSEYCLFLWRFGGNDFRYQSLESFSAVCWFSAEILYYSFCIVKLKVGYFDVKGHTESSMFP